MKSGVELLNDYIADGFKIETAALITAGERILSVRLNNGGNVVLLPFRGEQLHPVRDYLRKENVDVQEISF